MDEILKEAYVQKDNLIKNMKTVILSTKCDDAIPNASYAPSVLDSDGFYYIYISRLSKHANNLLSNKQKNEHHFYVSNYTESFEKSAKFFFKETIKLEEVNLFI